MPIGAIIGGVASIAGGAIASSGASSAADSAAQASAANNALQQQIYTQNTANEQPFMQRGNAAGAQMNALLGLAPATSGTAASPDWNAYLAANPDVQNAYNGLSAADKARFPTAQSYAQYHYGTYGQNEGRALPTTGGTAGQSSTDQQNAAFDNFKNSTGYQFAYDQGQNAVNNNYALRGALNSGAAMKAQTQYGQQTALNNAFLPYMNLLSGQQQTGLSAANALNGVGTNYANSVSSNNNNAASAAGSAAIGSANAWSGALGSTANAIGNLTGSSYGSNSPYSASSLANYNSLSNSLWSDPSLPSYGLGG